MTYDPFRNVLPRDPFRDYRDPNDTGAGAGLLLGAVMLLALGGFFYYFANTDAQNLATHEPRPPMAQPSSTGSGATTGSSSGTTQPPDSDVSHPKAKPVE